MMCTGILVTGLASTLYTMKGGMLSVIWTDFLQSIAMLLTTIITFSQSDNSVTHPLPIICSRTLVGGFAPL